MRPLPTNRTRPAWGRVLSLLVLALILLPLPGSSLGEVPPVPLDKEELAFFLGQSWADGGRFDLLQVSAGANRSFLVQTTLDPGLQRFMESRLSRVRAPMAALVALDPSTGEVKALVSHDRLPGRTNYALTPAFPAASVFKMVTAAAALEKGGLTPSSTIPFHGASHTLYRSQIKMPEPDAGRNPTLTEAFAKSFNPVFGKLANKPVGSLMLSRYADRFGFNQAIRFELPVAPSRSWVPHNDSYELALAGSGFNRKTNLSPLHGALMAAAVVNGGVMMEPTVVERVMVYKEGRLGAQIYRTSPRTLRQALTPQTASRMRTLMSATVVQGTGRRTFRRAKYDRVLKNLLLGGKTGSINDVTQTYRIDWFVGYAWERKTGRALALGVVVAHDLDRRGIGSRVLARDAFKYYFDPAPPKSPPATRARSSSLASPAPPEPREGREIRHKGSSKRVGP